MFEMDAPYKNVAQRVVFTEFPVEALISASFLGTKRGRWYQVVFDWYTTILKYGIFRI
jgi:hypothetical protein